MFASVITAFFYGVGRPGLNSSAVAGGLVATVVLDLLLIPSFEATGAAVASAVAYTLSTLFLLALFWRTARPHIAGRQIQHARAISHIGHSQQSPAAGLLHIIRMRSNRQHIQAHARAASFFRSSSISTLYLKAFTPSMAMTGTSSL